MTRRDALILLCLSAPFALVAGTLFVLAEWFSSGWDGLSRAIYGAVVVGIWALVVLGWCGRILLRDGLVATSIVPAIVLTGGLVFAGIVAGSIALGR